MTQRRPLVAANWKMNGSLAGIRLLLEDMCNGLQAGCDIEVAIFPPYVYLAEVAKKLKNTDIKLGSQNISHVESGAFTGEISADMLKDFSCVFAIVGHSERRAFYGETDDLVAEKFMRAQDAGLVPILCVGEQLHERESGETETVIERQLNTAIKLAGIEAFNHAVIAYEPVWAIGTGKTATPEQAQEVHAFVRLLLARHDDAVADKIRILYGGSVKAANAMEIFNMVDVDGGLIGGASLDAGEFLNIFHAARGS
jgi:triosephosphate isomerase